MSSETCTCGEKDPKCPVHGLSCEEYTLLLIAGPEDLPYPVRMRRGTHLSRCKYHQSSLFIQAAVDTPVTEELEKEALRVVEKYT